MAKSIMRSESELPPPSLTCSRTDAVEKIQRQIDLGKGLQAIPIGSEEDLERARAERTKWTKYNSELLTRLFTNASMAKEYDRFVGAVFSMNPTLSIMAKDFREGVADSVIRLEAIKDRLDLIPESQGGSSQKSSSKDADSSTEIFIVHGHDEATKQAVARLVEKLGLKAIILHEKPNASRTLIEKFEDYSHVGFSIVILTPDDKCFTSGNAGPTESRARQNVILELGFFLGKLTRSRVCALYMEGVELPSDVDGVTYIPIDRNGAWNLGLARELKHAGYPIDLNSII